MIYPVSVDVTPTETGALCVTPVWGGVDRPRVGGIVVKDMKTAARLQRAYYAGAAYDTPTIQTDVNGKTFVWAPTRVLGRTMNADLKKLGY